MKSNNAYREACLVHEIERSMKPILTDTLSGMLKKRLSIGYNAILTISFI